MELCRIVPILRRRYDVGEINHDLLVKLRLILCHIRMKCNHFQGLAVRSFLPACLLCWRPLLLLLSRLSLRLLSSSAGHPFEYSTPPSHPPHHGHPLTIIVGIIPGWWCKFAPIDLRSRRTWNDGSVCCHGWWCGGTGSGELLTLLSGLPNLNVTLLGSSNYRKGSHI